MRRGAVVTAIIAASLVAVMASVSSAKSGPHTFTVIEHATTDTIAGGGTGSNTGEVLTFHNQLFDESNADVVGSDQGECIRIDPVAGTWECNWTNFLEDGQVTVEGPFFDTADTTLAITGGTGAFKGVRGSMKLKAMSGGTEFAFVFHIVG